MPKLSVVIITYNEEKNIARCIESVQDIADDIVIVDSYSTDNTKSICEQYNVRFIEHKFEGHIQQKNWAITQAENPYILSLDADEVLSEQLKKSILQVKENWTCDGYYFNRLTNYCGKWVRHSGWYPDKKLRLWDSRKGKWAGVNPHDKFKLDKGSSQGYLKGDLLHFSFYSITQHIDQVNKFSGIAAIEAYNKGKKATLVKILLKPYWKFFRDYLLKMGILDGYYGYVICKISAHATFIKLTKLREQYKNHQSV